MSNVVVAEEEKSPVMNLDKAFEMISEIIKSHPKVFKATKLTKEKVTQLMSMRELH